MDRLVVLVFLGLSVWSGIGAFRAYVRHQAASRAELGSAGRTRAGYVRLIGVARPFSEVLHAPGSGEACVWYRSVVSAPRRSTLITVGRRVRDEDARKAKAFQSELPFWLEDATGRVLVEPEGLESNLSWRALPGGVSWGTDVDEQVEREQYVASGDRVCVVGVLGAGSGAIDERVAEILKGWKQNPEDLRRRFDVDGNDRIDPQEWESARVAARAQAMQTLKADGATRTLSRPGDLRPFLVSEGDRLNVKLGREVTFGVVLSACFFIAAMVMGALLTFGR